MIKAVFFDIDGTLLSHASGGVPDSAADALRRLRERGILVLAATGRHKRELEQLPVGHLQFDGYVASDGQICLDAGGALLYRLPIGRAAAEKLVDSFARREAPVLLVELEDMYINFVDQSVREAQRAISTPLPKIRDYRGGEIYQAIVFRDREYVARMAARLPGCRISGWHPYAFDIVPEEGGKALGIQKMLEHYGIRREECMAFGDGENDIDMLRYAGTGVAMGNAEEAVKRQADYVTGDIDDGGIREALEFYRLLP